jgi:hypothetical protein
VREDEHIAREHGAARDGREKAGCPRVIAQLDGHLLAIRHETRDVGERECQPRDRVQRGDARRKSLEALLPHRDRDDAGGHDERERSRGRPGEAHGAGL